jgi:hypothetical protein
MKQQNATVGALCTRAGGRLKNFPHGAQATKYLAKPAGFVLFKIVQFTMELQATRPATIAITTITDRNNASY